MNKEYYPIEQIRELYHFALASYKNHQWQQALKAYEDLLTLDPDHVPARFQLARILLEQHSYQEALQHFLLIEQYAATQFETLANIAVCFLQLNQLDQATQYYLRALNLQPKDSQILYNLGVIKIKQGKISEAISFYLQALSVDPNSYEINHNLAAAYLMIRDKQAALAYFRKALALKPSEVLGHTIQVLTEKENITEIPQSYISSLFDSYADHYDQHLVSTLQYHVPEMMYQALLNCLSVESSSLSILDLGCGTGLCGVVFKPLATHLMGIDLSSKMLEQAAEKKWQNKKVYDELTQAEALHFLKKNPKQYDLIIAGDVLGYIGELREIFSAIFLALQDKGWVIFSAEKEDEKLYCLKETGRFAYHQSYLHRLGKTLGFQCIFHQEVILRMQEGKPLFGYVDIWQKNK